jgi:nucleotide-binding universal stress UspA family protein
MGMILCALDGSPRAPGVLAAAVDLAHKLGHRLWLFRAVGLPAELPKEAYTVAPADLGGLLVEHAKAELDALTREVPRELIAAHSVELGMPWDSICRAARKAEAELIVIGAHGYGLVERVLGTTAAKVVNHADRSVLVVRR